MRNFSIQFTYPWLLLLLIPAAALTVFLYLRLNKKFRKNRNRVVSVILHSLVMVLCIFALSGMTFHYDVGNSENELVLLVDVSDTTEENREEKEDFVRSVLRESEYESCRAAVVTFGFTQETASPFMYDAVKAYDLFLQSDLPDTSATDIAAALQYAHGLFEHPETGKIVLVSDGKQTDEDAISVIRSIAAQGITVDTVYFPSDYSDEVVQITGIELPDRNVRTGEICPIDVIIESRENIEEAEIELFDNGSPVGEDSSRTVGVSVGTQTVRFNYAFREQGLHELFARVRYQNEKLQINNEYYAYRWLQVHNRLLILEQADESERLVQLLEEDEVNYEIDVVNLKTSTNIPTDVDGLRAYDQVILNNIASRDLEEKGLDVMLYDYVNTYGGGVFTTGGMEADGETAHAYNRSDMNNSLYQQILPVQAIDYTPPVGVMVVIDISGSMSTPGAQGRSNLEWAKQGALECLNALTERDYIGIMTMDTEYGMVLDLTPCTQDALIREKILGIGKGQTTVFSTAIDRATQRLANLQNVDKRHIILVTDGQPTEDAAVYLGSAANANKNHGITISVVGIGISEGSGAAANTMRVLVDEDHGNGRLHLAQGNQLLEEMRADVNAPAIKEVTYGEFNPSIYDALSPLLSGVGHGTDLENRYVIDTTLGGFFGVKARSGAEIVLVGEYEVPIYAQKKFGEGMVGSFMCDVYSDWSADFMASDSGKRFLQNVVANLMPVENIRPSSVRLDLKEDNYMNRLSVYASLEDGEYIDGKIIMQSDDGEISYSLNALPETQDGDVYVTTTLGAENNYSRANFVIKKSGIYKISVDLCAADGTVLETVEIYKAFSYSQEFNYSAAQDDAPEKLMAEIAQRGNGNAVKADEFWQIFSTFITSLGRVFDPRWLFIGLAMAFFLLDIAVRKFKFKWPHEIVREHKEKKAGKK